jgi:hypothetical protein
MARWGSNALAWPANLSDQDDQIGLAAAFGADTGGLQEMQTVLRERPPIDIAAALAAGNLREQLEAIPPLVALKKTAPGTDLAPILKSPKAYVAMKTLWRPSPGVSAFNSAQGRLVIAVCWEDAAAKNSRGGTLTQQAVEATWGYHGIAQFIGWQLCEPASKGIKIQVADVRPGSRYGKDSEAVLGPSMVLNFSFNSPDMIGTGCNQSVDNCILSVAIHEFGHALGFIHEQDSPDTPNWCIKKLKPQDIQAAAATLEAKVLTDWDEFSVMDYCFDIYKTRLQLSDCDIAAYRRLYPPDQGVEFAYQPKCPLRNE